jgi:hypothetical protein
MRPVVRSVLTIRVPPALIPSWLGLPVDPVVGS